MASAEPDNEGDGSGLDLVSKAKETAMNSCNSIKNSLGITHLLSLCISPLIHAVDIGSDANLAYRYYEDGEYLYSGLTAFFIAVPTVLISLLQKMYFQDFSPGSILKWIYQMVMMILPISPFLSSFQALNNVRFLKKTVTDFAENPDVDKFDVFQKRYESLQQEKSSSATLGVAEGFLKSAPQLVLQITIILTRAELFGSIHLYVSLASSFASTMKAFVGFYNSVQKNKTTFIGTILLYVWSSLVITSRIMSISLGVSIHPIETTAICIIHWVAMTMWLSFFESMRYTSPPKQGKLGKLLAQIPLEQLKLDSLTKVGSQVKDEALAKVGALASVFTRNEVQTPEANADTNEEVKAEAGAEEAQKGEEETPNGKEVPTKGNEKDVEAQEGEKGKENEKSAAATEKSGFIKKVFFSSIFGLIYIFVYVSIVEKPTRNKYAFYYYVWFLENCFFLVLGCRELWQAGAWFLFGLRMVTLGGVVLSMIVMFIYIAFYNVSLWPKKLDTSGGSLGLETAYQYGLNGLKAIDPTQLIPLKSINPTQFIPKLDSLTDKLPGAELVSGLIPEKLADNLPGAQVISNLIPGKEGNLTDAIPGTQLVSGLFSNNKEDSSPIDIPGANLVSGLLSNKKESLPGKNLISSLISKKDDDDDDEKSSSGNVPEVGNVVGLVSVTTENLSSAIPGAQLVSGLIPDKEEGSTDTIPGSGLLSELIPGKEESLPSAASGAELVSGLISTKEESLPSVIPGAQFVSGLLPGGKEENSSESAPAAQIISGLIPGQGGGSLKLWGK